jgi:SAM-dependent methyltransferase
MSRVVWILVAPLIVAHCCAALTIAGLEVPHAQLSPTSRALDRYDWPEKFPYSKQDLTPDWAGNDQMFYTLPKLGHHAGEECRASLTRFYECALPPSGEGDVLDLCSSFTSHFPDGWRARRCVALGLNPLELAVNPSKTEWRVQDLNKDPTLPYDDASFDVVTNSLSVDYMTSPLELFGEIHRVLRPGGLACMAFTNRCFPTKVVPAWRKPFTEPAHAQLVASYFRYAQGDWSEVGVVDVSPDGWAGQRDPAIVVVGRK